MYHIHKRRSFRLTVAALTALLFLFNTASLFGQTFNQKLDSISKQEQLCGMSLVVLALGEPVYHYTYGFQNVQSHTPTSDSTRYRVASVSKLITTIALMQLYERKLCSLDEDVSEYLGFSLRNPQYPDIPITLRMLLSHTASLNDGDGLGPFANATYTTDPPPPINELFTTAGKYYTANMFLPHAPGTFFTYCNMNFALIGTIIERLSGERFDSYCTHYIFNPLHLHCSFNLNAINLTTLAPLYRLQNNVLTPQVDAYAANTLLPKDPALYTIGTNGLLYLPLGGLRASAKELAVIMSCLAHKGVYHGMHILRDTTIKTMQKTYWQFNGNNGDANNALFQAWGAGTHIAQSHVHGDVVFPNDTLRGHMGDAYGLLSDAYIDKRGNGLVMITNGSALPFTNDSACGCYKTECKIFNAVYEYVQGCVNGVPEVLNDSGFKLNVYLQPQKQTLLFKYATTDNQPLTFKIATLTNHILATQKIKPIHTVGTYIIGNTLLKKGFYNLYVSYHNRTYQRLIYWLPPVTLKGH